MRELFEAGSIAVIGASPRPEKVGHVILRNLIASGYSGDLYPVNPKAGEILGLKAYPDVLSIPGPVEMAVVVVPNTVVPTVMEQAGAKGVKIVVVISAGAPAPPPPGSGRQARRGRSWSTGWGRSPPGMASVFSGPTAWASSAPATA